MNLGTRRMFVGLIGVFVFTFTLAALWEIIKKDYSNILNYCLSIVMIACIWMSIGLIQKSIK